jgi:hypothetical protein
MTQAAMETPLAGGVAHSGFFGCSGISVFRHFPNIPFKRAFN